MGNIVDLSKHQPSNKIDWATFSKNVDLLICRVQYGSSAPDCEYKNHIANAKKYNIPYNTYSFPCFTSVDDARVEARDAVSRQDKDSGILWLDIESEYDTNNNPVGITKLSQSVRLDGIKAYVDELRKQGVQKVGAYIAHNVYESWQINTIVGIFDTIWIPRYGALPKYPCDLHQYTESGNVPGFNGNLDLSQTVNKPLEYFTGKTDDVVRFPQPTVKPNGIIQVVKVLQNTDVRSEPNHTSAYIGDVHKDEIYNVWERSGDFHKIIFDVQKGTVGWVDGNGGANLSWINNPNGKQPQPTPQTLMYTVKQGDTVGKLAKQFGSTIDQIKAWNNLDNNYTIFAGKNIRVK